MTTYKEIKGTNIEVVSDDPSYPVDGQVWFNSTSNELKGNKGSPVAAWATVNDLNSGRYGNAGAGTRTAALTFGGNDPTPNPEYTAKTEKWNGTNWTEVNDLNSYRQYLGGCGSNTAALAFGGNEPPKTDKTETWNGTNWTEVNDMNVAKEINRGCGTTTAALSYGGFDTGYSAKTESWNGTNWTEVNDLNTARYGPGAAGTYTAALAFGGTTSTTPNVAVTETWNEPTGQRLMT